MSNSKPILSTVTPKPKRMKKVNAVQLRAFLDLGIIDQEGYDKALAEGVATEGSRNKLDILRGFEGFREIETSLNNFVEQNRAEIQERLAKVNQTFSKLSINVNK